MISVLIATYNRSEDLKMVLLCLEKQKLPTNADFEVIIIDNHSTDDTKSITESFLQTFQGRLKYLFEPQQGKPFAINRGLKEAKGDIIVLTDDDCVVESNYLASILKAFEESGSSIGFIGGKIVPRWVHCNKPEWFNSLKPEWFKEFFWGPLAILDYGDKPFVVDYQEYCKNKKLFYGANMAVRKELFLNSGGFSLEKLVAEDTELQLRFLKQDIHGLYAPQVKVHHKVTAGRLKPVHYYRWYFARGVYREIQERYQRKFYHPFGIQIVWFAKTIKLFIKSVFARSYTQKMYMRCKGIFNLGQMVQIAKRNII